MKLRIVSLTFLVALFLTLAQTRVDAKDDWLRVNSKNFELIGNASDKNIRRVATKLEQFREVFRRVFPGINFNSPTPTTVIVFKSDSSYTPYKPVNASGKTTKWIAGYFMPGEDVNYITLSTEGEAADTYRTIFHEYVHFLINNNVGRSNVPPWFNEGLAEYYSTFTIENDQKATLGLPQDDHLVLLQQNKLIPFDNFFNVSNYSLHQQGRDGAGLFYSQAWALMHYLIQGNGGARNPQLGKFINFVLDGKTPKEAFTQAFETDYATLERELKKYVGQSSYRITNITFDRKLEFESAMQTTPIDVISAKTYLGDLLYHTHRYDDAAKLLNEVLSAKPDSSFALTSLGLVKMRQKNFSEAREFLEKAIAADSKNYLAFYNYAYVLSREGMSEFGFISEYKRELSEKMLNALNRAIELNPNFGESYDLYAFVSLVRNENIEDAVKFIRKALSLAPGNQSYLIRLAELYMRKEDFANARTIAQRVAETAADRQMKLYAENTLERINSTEAQLEEIKNFKSRGNSVIVVDHQLSDEEIAALRDKAVLEGVNRALRKPNVGEKRVLGLLTKIQCDSRGINFTVRNGSEILKLHSANFDSVTLISYDPNLTDLTFDCDSWKKEVPAVVVYRPTSDAKSLPELLSIEIVPPKFKLL